MATSYEFIIDSYAWIEYFRGTSAGLSAKELIESGTAATSVVTLAELQEKWSSFDEDLKFITTRTAIISVDRELLFTQVASTTRIKRKSRTREWLTQ
jgi:predicted nucleic acid-binding protein